MQQFTSDNQTLSYNEIGTQGADVQIIWGHGWGHTHKALQPLAESLGGYHHYLLDFPGFGESPMPTENWDTNDYANFVAKFIEQLPPAKLRVWVGHSFGGRVGVQLGAKHSALNNAFVFVAGAGLRRKLNPCKRAYLKCKVYFYKFCKNLCRFGFIKRSWLESHFGSPDYRNAGALRPIFLNVIREHLADEAQRITAPTLLIYGEKDLETPPSMGEEYAKHISDADLHILHGLDHYSVLGEGQQQTIYLIHKFIKNLLKSA